MKDVVVTLTTKTASIPGANPGDAFVFSVQLADGSADALVVKTATKFATFKDVPTGDYTATVSRFGVEAETTFSVPKDETDNVDVPDTVSVNVVGV